MNNNNLLFLNFEAHKPPEFKEEKSKDYILWGTDKEYRNRYPDFLLHLRNNSATHNSIINGKVRFIVGKGLYLDEANHSLAERTQIESWLNNVGEESADELLKKIADDRETFGGYAVRPVWSKDKSRISFFHVDFSKIRVLKDSKGFAFTTDWKSRKPEDNEDYIEFTHFDADKKEENTLIYYKDYRPNLREYPNPSYIAGINYISADIDISVFTASNTSNGFQGGTLVSFYNGEPDEEAKRSIEKQFKDKFGGADKAGSVVLAFNKTDAKGVEITPLADNGQDERFINLSKQVQNSIFTAHETTGGSLFGVATEGGLNNNADEIRTASEHFKNSYADPRQQALLDLFNLGCSLNGWSKALYIRDLDPIKEQISIKDIFGDLTKDERRVLAGYEPLETEEESTDTVNVADVLGTLSPLVATKVLDNMSQEEIRALVGLKGTAIIPNAVESNNFCSHSFSDNKLDLALSNTGFKDEELEVIDYLETGYNPFTFAIAGTTAELLAIIKENPTLGVKALSELIGESQFDTLLRLQILKNEGLVKEKDGVITPTDENEKSELITVYKYIERPDAPPLKTESRDFCRTMLTINRSYTREQITLLSNEFGNSVWNNRGGWYNNPSTGVTTPYCRHIWQGRTVKLKN